VQNLERGARDLKFLALLKLYTTVFNQKVLSGIEPVNEIHLSLTFCLTEAELQSILWFSQWLRLL
jgi:hypothetical protein